VECFAGSAGLSCWHEPAKVLLIEKDPIIANVWDFLIRVKASEIMRLPANILSIEELPARTPEPARNLVGFWLNAGIQRPVKTRSPWARTPRYASRFWSESVKLRICSQLSKIRAWRIIEGDWWQVPDDVGDATYFVDPPYSGPSGRIYKFNSVDYKRLGRWCRTRSGQVIACEGSDNTGWLPFGEPYALIHSRRPELTAEVLWERELP
jgi:hypothetical protein